MTPAWPPTSWVAGALDRLGHAVPDVPWELAGAGADWVCAAPLRLARGDRDRAVALAAALAEDLAARPEVVAARPTGGGHLAITLTDEALGRLLGGASAAPWGEGEASVPGRGAAIAGPVPARDALPTTSLTVRARTLDDPGYRALLAHARLSGLLREAAATGAAATQVGGAAYALPPHEVLVLGVDAGRVAERVTRDGRAHHVVDWTARVGAAVVLWTDTSTRSHPVDPLLVGALRDRLASALRAVGLTPTERL